MYFTINSKNYAKAGPSAQNSNAMTDDGRCGGAPSYFIKGQRRKPK